MIHEFETNQYKMIVVYKLDRISRNVLDFCSLKDKLQNLNIDFISITECFDTSSPIGSAMLLIASVFAQLERETIAQRIKDNMLELSKTGRWLGGNTPLGYSSIKVNYYDINNKRRVYYKLIINKEEIKKVKLIFNKYLEFNSLSKLERYLFKLNIKSRNNCYFSRFTLKEILNNIVYCKADNDIKKYLCNKKIKYYDNSLISSKSNGLISYNKRCKRKSKNGKSNNIKKDINNWIIAVGCHEGVISGKDWINVYESLNSGRRNIKENFKTKSLLSGILVCKKCGSFMHPKVLKSFNKNNIRNFVYICELKSKSNGKKCKVVNIDGNRSDQYILDILSDKIKNESNTIIIRSIIKRNLEYLYCDNKKIYFKYKNKEYMTKI